MADCYALNVARDATWAYYYTEFPLVRIGSDREIRWWSTKVHGAHAFAVDGQRIVLFGGYSPHRDRCVVGELRDRHEMITIEECRLVLADGKPLNGARVIGRGPILHAFTDEAWHQIDMRSL